MKKNTRKRFLGSLITVALIATLLPGCGQKKEVSAAASEIKYSSKGEYTTTLSVEGTDVKSLKAEDIKITYILADTDGFQKSASGASISEEDMKKYFTEKEAEVTSVSAKSDTQIDISFTDKDAAAKATGAYTIKAEKKNITASALVIFEPGKLTPDLEYVLASDKDIRLTLTLAEGSFSDSVTKEDITLSGSFEGLNIDSLSCAGKNLTMQLTGNMTMHEDSGVYLDGLVTVAEKCIVDATGDSVVTIPVREQTAFLVPEKINVEGSNVTIPLTLIDITDVDNLTKDQVTFEKDVKVTDLKKTSASEVLLSLEIEGVKDKNTAAAALDGQKVKVGSFEFIAQTSGAGFYPVFDYVEEEGGNLKFTLKLYANNGTFAENISDKSISYDNGFKDAKTISFKKESDTTAELILSVPANGQSSENLNMAGEVIISGGGLINKWGDSTTDPAKYLREYTKESMGKDLSTTDIAAIKGIVGGFGNTTFGTLAGVASGAGTAYSVAKTILETTGVIESEHVQVMNGLKKISNTLSTVQSVSEETNKLLKEMHLEQYDSQLTAFDKKLSGLMSSVDRIESTFKQAKKKVPADKLPTKEQPSFSTLASSASWTEYDADWHKYIDSLLEVISSDKSNIDFASYNTTVNDLINRFQEIADTISINSGTGSSNPIRIFDKLCPYTCNFSSTAFYERTQYRAIIKLQLQRALAWLMLCYNYKAGNNDSTIDTSILPKYNTAISAIDGLTVENPPKKNYCYTWNCEIEGLDSQWNSIMIINKPNQGVSAAQVDEFVNRMHGRTLRQELTRAGISIPVNNSCPIEGVYFGMVDLGGQSIVKGYSQQCYITIFVAHHSYQTGSMEGTTGSEANNFFKNFANYSKPPVLTIKWDENKLSTAYFSEQSNFKVLNPGKNNETEEAHTNFCCFKGYSK